MLNKIKIQYNRFALQIVGVASLLVFMSPDKHVAFELYSGSINTSSVAKEIKHLKPGKGTFEFNSAEIQGMKIWYYIPPDVNPKSPVLFVMHGVKRNADEYRNGWVNAAKRAGFILIVPEFSQKLFPRSRSYNLGNMFSKTGQANPQRVWSFNMIEPLFTRIKSLTNNKTKEYHLFGHSAGAQFVHRYLIFAPHERLGLLIAANAGWYTTLDDNVVFPYGLMLSPRQTASLAPIFNQDVVILLGEKDNDPKAEFLRQTPEARQQGAHRLARGTTFFNDAKKLAADNHWSFQWQLVTVPNVGHDNKGMANSAIRQLQAYLITNAVKQ